MLIMIKKGILKIKYQKQTITPQNLICSYLSLFKPNKLCSGKIKKVNTISKQTIPPK